MSKRSHSSAEPPASEPAAKAEAESEGPALKRLKPSPEEADTTKTSGESDAKDSKKSEQSAAAPASAPAPATGAATAAAAGAGAGAGAAAAGGQPFEADPVYWPWFEFSRFCGREMMNKDAAPNVRIRIQPDGLMVGGGSPFTSLNHVLVDPELCAQN
jgi:hypothetical protein